MTEKKIKSTLKAIETCKRSSHLIEALFINYHLNIDMLRFLAVKICKEKPAEELKAKKILDMVVSELESDVRLKTTINKKNLKTLKPWLVKMDEYIKTIRVKKPTHTSGLLSEGEKIFAILNISVSKILLNK